jgi:hypothetical protein
VAGGYRWLVPVDIDTDDPAIIDATCAALPKPAVIKVGKRGFTAFYRGNVKARKYRSADDRMLVELLTTGQTLLPPTEHPETKRLYRWATADDLFNMHITQLSVITDADLDRLQERLSRWCPPPRFYQPMPMTSVAPVNDKRMRAYAVAVLAGEVRAVSAQPSPGRNFRLFQAVCKLGKYRHHGILSEAEIVNAMMQAATANGLVNTYGTAHCLRTIRSGFKFSVNDRLQHPMDRSRAD